MNKHLTDNNYIYIPNFISIDHANYLHNKFVNYCIEENLPGDSQAENSHAVYNYIDFLELFQINLLFYLYANILPLHRFIDAQNAIKNFFIEYKHC